MPNSIIGQVFKVFTTESRSTVLILKKDLRAKGWEMKDGICNYLPFYVGSEVEIVKD